jgi:dienelactone hydrolase
MSWDISPTTTPAEERAKALYLIAGHEWVIFSRWCQRSLRTSMRPFLNSQELSMAMRSFLTLVQLVVVFAFIHGAHAQDPVVPGVSVGATFEAKDSLNCGPEEIADASQCLAGLKWECTPFPVKIEAARPGCGEWLVRFPSPAPVGDAVNDLVSMEWYVARDKERQPMRAPTVVVVHESGKGMVAGRLIAKGLQLKGLHTFLIHLPGYGARRSPFTEDISKMLPGLRQAVTDVRRARDAVAVLPLVDTSMIGVQGTSLGGFVVATVAGLDRGYNRAFVLLAGGNIADVLLTGAQDAARFRNKLTKVGVTEAQIKEMTQIIEPMRLAHRVDASKTWLFSGKFDDVVPPRCSHSFAKAASLPDGHHLVMPVGHYTAAVLLPIALNQIGNAMRKSVASGE